MLCKTLLYTIATHVCLNKIRSARRRPEETTENDLLARIAQTEKTESSILARGVLRKLFGGEKVSTQTIAVLHLLDGLTLEEVADQVGLSVSGVRKRLRLLRGRLVELEGIAP
jgi:RNA polymerase sigma-70 factor (ECF subfamily)